MLNEEDPVHAAISPARTAGRTAARTAVAAADLHRPVPRRQGSRRRLWPCRDATSRVPHRHPLIKQIGLTPTTGKDERW